MEEISEQAMLAAIVELAPDAAAELPRNSRRVRSHIQNALLQRYRQEWSFNRRFGGRIVGEPAQPDDADRDSLFNGQALHAALAALSASDRQLIAQLYWENRTESQIAAEAGVSVPAICKHKRRIFRDLAENLKNIKL
jgi:DNA-directed RNA polymerase specialized sigma24 family protein